MGQVTGRILDEFNNNIPDFGLWFFHAPDGINGPGNLPSLRLILIMKPVNTPLLSPKVNFMLKHGAMTGKMANIIPLKFQQLHLQLKRVVPQLRF